MATSTRVPSPSAAVISISNIANGDVVAVEQFQTAGLNALQDFMAWLLQRVRRVDDASTIQFAYSATNTLTMSVASGLAVGDPVVASTSGTLPTGMSTLTTYYVKTISGVEEAATVTLSATYGGATLSITAAGSGTHTFTPLRPFVDRNSWKREYDPTDADETMDPIQYQVFRVAAVLGGTRLYTLPDLTVGAGFDGLTVKFYRNISTTNGARVVRADATIIVTFSATGAEWADFRWDDSDAEWRCVAHGGTNITVAEV